MDCPFSAGTHLGVGIARVKVMFRGGLIDLGDIPYASASYVRRMDTWGEATVTVNMNDCCDGLSPLTDIDPLAHELVITRMDDASADDRDGFVGPITTVRLRNDLVTITARSLDWWWHRVVLLGGYSGHPRELMRQVITATEEQLSLGMNGVPIIRDDDDMVGEREREWVQANDAVDDLTSSGLHYTVIGRTVVYGEALHTNSLDSQMTQMTPGDFVTDDASQGVEIVKSGLNYSSRVMMKEAEEDSNYYTAVDDIPEAYYGVAINLQSDRAKDDSGVSVKTQAKEQLSAQNRIKVMVPQQTHRLAPHAPILFDELIPGMPIGFSGTVGCIDFDETLALGDITVSYRDAEETVEVDFMPMTAELVNN